MEKYTDRLSNKRTIFVILIGLEFVLGSIIFSIVSSAPLDRLISIIFISFAYFLTFVIVINRDRLDGKLLDEIYVSYAKIAIAFLFAWCVIIISYYIPDYFAPIMIASIILGCALNSTLAISASVYLILIFAMVSDKGVNVFVCYSFMALLGCMICGYAFKSDMMTRMFSALIVFSLNILISLSFYYLNYLEINNNSVIYAAISSLVVALALIVICPLMAFVIKRENDGIYDYLIEDGYSLVEEIKNFSNLEFRHAQRVSYLAGVCAQEVQLNDKLARCSGFYYRLGKIYGEPEIDNAIKAANNNCFPVDVINVIAEYGGILTKPSTPESAIVHMVDAIVTKIEILDQDTMQSNWNQNIVIYQTLNELSQSGIYDDSGLSINRFLSVREKLTKEDILV